MNVYRWQNAQVKPRRSRFYRAARRAFEFFLLSIIMRILRPFTRLTATLTTARPQALAFHQVIGKFSTVLQKLHKNISPLALGSWDAFNDNDAAVQTAITELIHIGRYEEMKLLWVAFNTEKRDAARNNPFNHATIYEAARRGKTVVLKFMREHCRAFRRFGDLWATALYSGHYRTFQLLFKWNDFMDKERGGVYDKYIYQLARDVSRGLVNNRIVPVFKAVHYMTKLVETKYIDMPPLCDSNDPISIAAADFVGRWNENILRIRSQRVKNE